MPTLSVLDLAPVVAGSDATEAYRRSTVLARHVEDLGYERLWYAEHHNIRTIASVAPEVLIAHAGAHTSRIRLGAGGVMLPNHAPLAVAERYATLEALHPGRIDLALGRAPGSDQMAALALRGSVDALRADDFPEQVAQLRAFLTDGFPEGHPFRAVQVIPGPGYVPALWLLGSSDFGARLAGMLGLPFGFAHHFAPHGTESGIAAYLESFRPDALDQPYALIGVAVFCAESDTEAAGLARAGALAWARSRTGGDGRVGRVEEAERYEPTLAERHVIEERMAHSVHGPPEAVRTRLDELAARFDVQELMLTTTAYDEEARLRSYELIAEMYDLAGEPA